MAILNELPNQPKKRLLNEKYPTKEEVMSGFFTSAVTFDIFHTNVKASSSITTPRRNAALYNINNEGPTQKSAKAWKSGYGPQAKTHS